MTARSPTVTPKEPAPTKIFAVAPMMDWTDRHCRAFHRSLTRRALLYTEMVTAAAVTHGDRDRLLGFSALEHPVALQLGGSDPKALAEAAKIGEDFGYDEINLNVGCPSDRVQSGRFGACLMREPNLVAECAAAMKSRVDLPVTVKCRLGVDDQIPEESLETLVDACVAAGVTTFVVHARMAWLKGLSPKENREVPPLDYALVRKLKLRRPGLTVILNGGLKTLEAACAELAWADGVMLGRAAYQNPGLLLGVDGEIFGEAGAGSEAEALSRYRPYLADQLARGTPLHAMTRHMLGLFAGAPGARAWRRILTTEALETGAGLEVLDRGLEALAAAQESRARAA